MYASVFHGSCLQSIVLRLIYLAFDVTSLLLCVPVEIVRIDPIRTNGVILMFSRQKYARYGQPGATQVSLLCPVCSSKLQMETSPCHFAHVTVLKLNFKRFCR